MNDTKTWWQSRTIWSALVVVVSQALSLAGIIELDDARQQQIVDATLSVVSIAAGIAAVGFRRSAAAEIR